MVENKDCELRIVLYSCKSCKSCSSHSWLALYFTDAAPNAIPAAKSAVKRINFQLEAMRSTSIPFGRGRLSCGLIRLVLILLPPFYTYPYKVWRSEGN